MSHWTNADIHKALVELAPEQKEVIGGLKFGEIKGS